MAYALWCDNYQCHKTCNLYHTCMNIFMLGSLSKCEQWTPKLPSKTILCDEKVNGTGWNYKQYMTAVEWRMWAL